MGFTIPNATTATVIDQSEPDSGDFVALGDRKTGVVSGCAVTAQSVNSTSVDVAAGEVLTNGAYKTIGSVSVDLGVGTSGSARFDLVVVNSAGTVTNRDGTSYGGSNPSFPPLQDGDVFLAAVYRAAGTGDVISSTRIIDKRVSTPSNVVRTGAGAPSNSLGNVGDIYVNTSISSNTGQSQVYIKSAASLWEPLAEYVGMGDTTGAGTLVLRGTNGNFSAGTITANLTGTATNVPWTGVTGRPTVGNVVIGTSASPTYTGTSGDIYIQV